jgi:murein DD-endopeptidase MepM/ murein hydrolase activator NlpD
MRPAWRAIVKTVAVTATLTTLFWFAMAAWWYRSLAPQVSARQEAPRKVELLSTRSEPVRVDESTPLVIPVVGVRRDQLSDTFTQARASGQRSHDAIDIMAQRGTPVVAAAPGRVEKLFLSKDGGNTVYVRSPDGRRIYSYAHLDRYAPELREGMALRQGAPIGAVGSTGNADPAAPHLHFAVWMTAPERKWWEDALALNPYPMLTGS